MSLTKTEFRKRKEGIGPEREKKDSSDDKGILERWNQDGNEGRILTMKSTYFDSVGIGTSVTITIRVYHDKRQQY